MSEFKPEDFDEILKDYDIGDFKRIIFKRSEYYTSVHIIETTKNKFIIKSLEGDSSKRENFEKRFKEFEAKISEFLIKKGFNVNKIIGTKSDKLTTTYKNNTLYITDYIEGKIKDKLDDDDLKQVSNRIALMHKIFLNNDFESKWAGWFSLRALDKDKSSYLKASKEQRDELKSELKTIDFDKLRKCVIHADLNRGNFIFKNDNLKAIIDWGASHKSYRVHDVAYYFVSTLIKDIDAFELRAKDFLRTYKKILKNDYLNDGEKKALYYFIKFHLLSRYHQHKRDNFLKRYPNESVFRKKILSEEGVPVIQLNYTGEVSKVYNKSWKVEDAILKKIVPGEDEVKRLTTAIKNSLEALNLDPGDCYFRIFNSSRVKNSLLYGNDRAEQRMKRGFDPVEWALYAFRLVKPSFTKAYDYKWPDDDLLAEYLSIFNYNLNELPLNQVPSPLSEYLKNNLDRIKEIKVKNKELYDKYRGQFKKSKYQEFYHKLKQSIIEFPKKAKGKQPEFYLIEKEAIKEEKLLRDDLTFAGPFEEKHLGLRYSLKHAMKGRVSDKAAALVVYKDLKHVKNSIYTFDYRFRLRSRAHIVALFLLMPKTITEKISPKLIKEKKEIVELVNTINEFNN